MTQWQFLIRKEDDQAWLPLESLNTEILEGRYQLVVDLGVAAVPIEVQINHEFEQDGLFRQTRQHKLLMTDLQGQIDLTSLTYFAPGRWDVKCQIPEKAKNDLSTALELESVTLSLDILAQEYGCLEDWDLFMGQVPVPQSIPQTELVGANGVHQGAATSRSHPQGQLNPIDLRVALPVIPKDLPPLELFTVENFQLPPTLYRPTPDALVDYQLQLPCLPRLEIFATHPEPFSETELVNLRELAKEEVNNRAAQRDFQQLSLQEKFLETLSALAKTPLATSSLLILQEILAATLGHPNPSLFERRETQHDSNPELCIPDLCDPEETPSLLETGSVADTAPPIPTAIASPDEPELSTEALLEIITDSIQLPAELPIPRLILSTGTLLAEEPIPLLVRLPQSADALQVKIWMNDRYTGDPLGEMTLLTDWELNGGLGVLEASTQIAPPPGCFAIRFSAVTVDPQNEIESGVVVVDRYIGIQN
jgi:hypothetical protein